MVESMEPSPPRSRRNRYWDRGRSRSGHRDAYLVLGVQRQTVETDGVRSCRGLVNQQKVRRAVHQGAGSDSDKIARSEWLVLEQDLRAVQPIRRSIAMFLRGATLESPRTNSRSL